MTNWKKWSKKEIAIVKSYKPQIAFEMLKGRTLSAITQRKWSLNNSSNLTNTISSPKVTTTSNKCIVINGTKVMLDDNLKAKITISHTGVEINY